MAVAPAAEHIARLRRCWGPHERRTAALQLHVADIMQLHAFLSALVRQQRCAVRRIVSVPDCTALPSVNVKHSGHAGSCQASCNCVVSALCGIGTEQLPMTACCLLQAEQVATEFYLCLAVSAFASVCVSVRQNSSTANFAALVALEHSAIQEGFPTMSEGAVMLPTLPP